MWCQQLGSKLDLAAFQTLLSYTLCTKEVNSYMTPVQTINVSCIQAVNQAGVGTVLKNCRHKTQPAEQYSTTVLCWKFF